MSDGFKSLLGRENSILLSAATVALVAGVYQLDVGPVSSVHATDAYSPAAGSSIRKAGATGLILVAGIAVLARDPNVVILGGAALIAFHSHYRHANMVHPATGQIVPPGPASFQPAQNLVPMAVQGYSS